MSIAHALSVRSDFSLGESVLQVERMLPRAKELGYETVALVDIMTVSNLVSFSEKAKKAGIKPIIGCTVRVYEDPTYREPTKKNPGVEKNNPFYWLKVYARTELGLQSIMRLLSKGNSKENFYYHARVGLKDILELEDCVVTTGDFYNVFHRPDYKAIVKALSGSLLTFVEIVPISTPLFDTLNQRALETAAELGLSTVATSPVLYENAEDAGSVDVLRAITTNAKMKDPWLSLPYVRDFHMKAPIELAKALRASGLPIDVVKNALEGTQTLADLCSYEFKKMPPSLPKLAPDEFVAVVEECKAGWVERFARSVLGHKPDPADYPTYRARLAYELGVLKRMEVSGYFLLVQDIVKWSKSNGIIVGPGRGSVGGSLVAYLMGITDVDPIRFDLLFERFINPERIDLPDADLDFMSRRRHEVLAYITSKYGVDRVAGVSNYNGLGAAAAMRDVSRVHGMDPLDYSCSKLVEKVHGVALTLEQSAEVVPEIDKFKSRYPDIWKHATTLEGALRGLGQHAAGIVVAGEPLTNRCVVETRSGGPVVNWDKKYVEEWGLIKMDVLGLSTLDMLELGRQYVKERHGVDVNYLTLSLDDARVLQGFAKGQTQGVFQFESPGMRRLLQQLAGGGPLTFDDLVAVVALYRPGPIDAGLPDQYVEIKQGTARPYYEHDNMKEALKGTFGVIVYQEQVMQICGDVAGFTLAEADHVRKAMGKKDLVMMKEWADKFVSGCGTKSGMDPDVARGLWDKIEVFAGYAFNKSHSVEYSIISYWSMWLKVNYPAEFYAASITITNELSSSDKSEDKLEGLVLDARKRDIQILPPDINLSSGRIEIVGDDKLYAPFQAVKGISDNVAGHILKARADFGDFTDYGDFEAKILAAKVGGKVNKAHRDRLKRIGAFARIEGDPIPALHSDRLKDRLELLPGFTVDVVKATRGITADDISKAKLVRLAEETRTCDKCSLKGNAHPLPRLGTTPKFMMVFDTPNWKEEKAGRLLEGDSALMIMSALKDAGLHIKDGYFTTLVKSGKPKGEKSLTNEQINGCSPFLMQEIEILKPPVIVIMGAAVSRFFMPGLKGGGAEHIGKVVYDPKLDASIILGFNPAQIIYDPSKLKALHVVCERISELIT